MCGLAFALAPRPVSDFIGYANHVQRHRGPDAQSTHYEQIAEVHLGMGHRRLAILDLSDAGTQPMVSASGRAVMVFNGEIYNFAELAAQFRLPRHTETDSEVALELIERLGIEEASRQFNGMWAIAVFDRKLQRLYLSRDRFGKKPLNYLERNGAVYGASELKAFAGIKGFSLNPDPVTAGRFLVQSLQNIDEHTWIKGVRAFPAASTAWIDVLRPDRGLQQLGRFWRPSTVPDIEKRGEEAVADELRQLLTDSVRLRSRADVPVAIALSGGLDSSILASISKKLGDSEGKRLGLLSVVHPGERHDESGFVRSFSQHHGLDVQTFTLDLQALEALQELVASTSLMNDGPIPSFAPALFQGLMQKARETGFKVVLTGQGADEAFCGYRKYPLWQTKRFLLRNPVSAARFIAPFVMRGTLLPQLRWREAKRYVTGGNVSILGEQARACFVPEPLGRGVSSVSELQIADLERFSVPYLCHYEDRMSMASSVEVRAPFLDYRVVTLGLSIPTSMKMGGGWSKYILRRAFENDLPREIAWRKDKMGFSNPEDAWMRRLAPLVFEEMTSANAPAYRHGLIDRSAYLDRLRRYLAGDRSIWFREVFGPYSLNAWLTSLDRRR